MDISHTKDRLRFFHTHRTRTPASDPRVAEAILHAFFPDEPLVYAKRMVFDVCKDLLLNVPLEASKVSYSYI